MTQVRAKITPVLWFDDQAEEAARFYVSIFPDSEMGDIHRCGPAGPLPPGEILSVTFTLAGVGFAAVNGGPHFEFTEAVSFAVACQTQAEIDRYWEMLTAGGGIPGYAGWARDRFGVFWQVVPAELPGLISDPEDDKAQRAIAAMLKMTKLDLAELRRAYAG